MRNKNNYLTISEADHEAALKSLIKRKQYNSAFFHFQRLMLKKRIKGKERFEVFWKYHDNFDKLLEITQNKAKGYVVFLID